MPTDSFPTCLTLADSALQQLFEVVSLRAYNTRIVVLGVSLLGVAAGTVGTFLLLRRRALMSDALSHAMLPGVCAAFLIMATLGVEAKHLPGLLAGAAVFGVIGAASVLFVRRFTRLKEDAAMGIVLSVYFALGIALLGMATRMQTGSAAGLEKFIYGKTASMVAADAQLIAVVGLVTVIVCGLLFKELTVLCFDEGFTRAQGWSATFLDGAMMTLAVAVTVIGLQAVGLILIVALLIIPPAAARFWTDHLPRMTVIAAIIGGLSGAIGAMLSAGAFRALVELVTPGEWRADLPAGAVIVVVASCLFAFSMLFGPARGVVVRGLRHRILRRTVGRQHLLRAMYEWVEERGGVDGATRTGAQPRASDEVESSTDEATAREAASGVVVPWDYLLAERSWNAARLNRLLRWATGEGLVARHGDTGYTLTAEGMREAERLVRNHRLWELYLITHADIAPSHVDRDADMIEHVLGPQMVAKLEALLHDESERQRVPQSPHILGAGDVATGGAS